jgi:tetratricopeptide (TPR) repeat protein
MWRERSIFISSTFADMQAERDHLRNFVFPELEERLRQRRQNLEWVDLRLGVATASLAEGEARELQVLKVCLAEVRRCRPFLIVLLGDRYGWVPPADRATAAATEEGLDADVAGRSVTDLEISFGVLDDPDHRPRSFFYFREPLPYAEMAPEVAALYADAQTTDTLAAEGFERLATLKRRIAGSLPGRVRPYSVGWDGKLQRVVGLDVWGRQVLEDIWREIDAETAAAQAAPEPSWQQAERDALDDYVEERTRDFRGRREVLARLEQHAGSPADDDRLLGVVLTGDPGSGKSAAFGELLRHFRAGETFVLAHAAGASLRSPSVETMLRRWIEELATALRVDVELADNANPDTINATFWALLAGMAAQRRVVIAVDGLDQFEATTQARHVTWLPALLPTNVRFIATAIPGEASGALRQRPAMELMPLEPLDVREARGIAEAICARYHRTLEPEVVEALLAKRSIAGPALGNPLWLVLAVEELNLLDADDFVRATKSYTGALAERLRALMLDIVGELPADIPGLYRVSFERAEQLFGMFLARAFIGSIAVSRAGWRETDFRSLLPQASGKPWDELRFASLRRLFRGQLRRRGVSGQWDFAHNQMREAARQYLAALSVSEAEFHTEIAEHLLMLPREDTLRQTETMVHLVGSEGWAKAAGFYGDPALTVDELDGAAEVLAACLRATSTAEMGLQHVQKLLDAYANDLAANSIAASVALRLAFELDEKISAFAPVHVRETLHRSIESSFNRLILAEPRNGEWRYCLFVSQQKIGDLLVDQGNLPAALKYFRASQAIFDRMAKTDPNNVGRWQSDFALSQQKIGDVLVAQGYLMEGIDHYSSARNIWFRLAKIEPANATLQRDLSALQIKIANVLTTEGKLVEALEAYRTAQVNFDRLTRADPDNASSQRDLSVSHAKIGEILLAQGDLPAALQSFQISQRLFDNLVKNDPNNAKWKRELYVSQIQIGDVLRNQGYLADAFKAYQASHAIVKQLVNTDPSNTGWHEDLAASQNRIGNVLFAKRSLPDALVVFQAAQVTFERLTKIDPSNVNWQRDLSVSHDSIGDVLRAQGHLADALKAYQTSLAITEELAQNDPGNTTWQADRAASHGRLGSLYSEMGLRKEAIGVFSRGRALIEPIVARYPDVRLWQQYRDGFDRALASLSG